MMTDTRVLLPRGVRDLHRVVEDAAGEWYVKPTLTEYEVTCLAEDRSNPRVVYAGTREHGVWRSGDFGHTWTHAGMQGRTVKSLAVNPHDPDTLYAGSKPALIFRSQDGGESWHELESFRRIPNRWWWFSPADPPDRRPYVIEIAPSPVEPEVLLAGVEFGGVSRSDDGGESWSPHIKGTLRDCHSLKFHTTDGRYAYEAGGTGGGASMSRDGGRTWRKVKQGLAKSYGIVCAADGVNPEIWYACVGASPWKSTGEDSEAFLYRSDGSERWEPIGWAGHPLKETATVMVSVPGASGELYVGTHKGSVWHTADYGESWVRLPIELNAIWHAMLIRSL